MHNRGLKLNKMDGLIKCILEYVLTSYRVSLSLFQKGGHEGGFGPLGEGRGMARYAIATNNFDRY